MCVRCVCMCVWGVCALCVLCAVCGHVYCVCNAVV